MSLINDQCLILLVFITNEIYQIAAKIIFAYVQSNDLSDHIKFDHGYTASSPPVVNVSTFSPHCFKF